MQQNLQYMEKTAVALQNLKLSAMDLDNYLDSEIIPQRVLKETVANLKDELKEKAQRIDDIIKTLNGALK